MKKPIHTNYSFLSSNANSSVRDTSDKMNNQKSKDIGIEALRGLAIILVVAFHVIGTTPTSGIRIADGSVWRYFTYTFEFIRLPLFVTISGFVYSIKPVQRSYTKKFLLGKARRLLLPFLTVSTLQYIANTYAPNTNNHYEIQDIWEIYVFPWAQFWYLEAMAIVFIAIWAIESYTDLLKNFKKWVVLLICSVTILVLLDKDHHSGFLCFWGAVYILPFFMFGIGIFRFGKQLFNPWIVIVSATVLAIGLTIQQLAWHDLAQVYLGRRNPFTLLMGFTLLILMFKYRSKIPVLLSRLGYYAYAIYLFHIFVASGLRIFLISLGVENKVFLFVPVLLSALIIPIFIEMILLQFRWARYLFLGLR